MAKKKYVPKSPTAKALQELRAQGWFAEKVEQRLPIPGKFVTRDLFDCIDIVAIRPECGILGLQVTTRANVNARMHKAKQKAFAVTWVQAGGSFEIWGYGGKKTLKRVVGLDRNGDWMEEAQVCGNSSVEWAT